MTGKEEVRIRKMTEADLPRIRELDRVLAGPHRDVSWPLRIEAHWWVYRGMPNFVAEVGTEIVGFVLGDMRSAEYEADACGWIDMMGVAPEHQGKGIGRRLVEAFCHECTGHSAKVRVVVLRDNERLVRFWESVGFREGNLISYEKCA